jgi:hypothetical protein
VYISEAHVRTKKKTCEMKPRSFMHCQATLDIKCSLDAPAKAKERKKSQAQP